MAFLLTRKQKKLARLLEESADRNAIAERMRVKPATVKRAIHRARKRLTDHGADISATPFRRRVYLPTVGLSQHN